MEGKAGMSSVISHCSLHPRMRVSRLPRHPALPHCLLYTIRFTYPAFPFSVDAPFSKPAAPPSLLASPYCSTRKPPFRADTGTGLLYTGLKLPGGFLLADRNRGLMPL